MRERERGRRTAQINLPLDFQQQNRGAAETQAREVRLQPLLLCYFIFHREEENKQTAGTAEGGEREARLGGR